MEIDVADIVESENGRDQGKAFFVVGTEESYVHIADGKSRKLEFPKRKKKKHVRFIKHGDCRTAEKLRSGDKVQNSEIRKALAAFAAGAGQMQGGL